MIKVELKEFNIMDAYILGIMNTITQPKKKMMQLYKWYIYSNPMQSVYHNKDISSLRHDIRKSSNDSTELEDNILNSLQQLFSAYFTERVEVDIVIVDKENKLYIKFSVKVYSENKSYTLEENIGIDDRIIYENDSIINKFYEHVKY